MQDTQMPHEGEAVCKLCWDALSPAETWQDRGGKHWEFLLKLNSHTTGVDSYEKWDEKKTQPFFHDVTQKNIQDVFIMYCSITFVWK